MRPWIDARLRLAKRRWDSGHQPMGYHKDIWPGQWFCLVHLLEDLRTGEPFSEDDE